MANTRGRIGQAGRGAPLIPPSILCHASHASEQISYRQKQRQKAADCSISELHKKSGRAEDWPPTCQKWKNLGIRGHGEVKGDLLSDNFSAEPKPIRAEFTSVWMYAAPLCIWSGGVCACWEWKMWGIIRRGRPRGSVFVCSHKHAIHKKKIPRSEMAFGSRLMQPFGKDISNLFNFFKLAFVYLKFLLNKYAAKCQNSPINSFDHQQEEENTTWANSHRCVRRIKRFSTRGRENTHTDRKLIGNSAPLCETSHNVSAAHTPNTKFPSAHKHQKARTGLYACDNFT